MNSELKTFSIYRKSDTGGVSGKGRVLDGVIFHNGWVVVCWRTDIEGARHGHSSIAMYPSWENFEYLHIAAHPENKTIVVYGDDANLAKKIGKQISKI
ncbi:MAG: hypothetical protein H8D23_38325 [Candidatus Brocadiales bacterium]|nr:hypothetical protein [Candidatus Brocadiales bacterium]